MVFCSPMERTFIYLFIFLEHRHVLFLETKLNSFLLKEPKCSTFVDLFSSDKQLSGNATFLITLKKKKHVLPFSIKVMW